MIHTINFEVGGKEFYLETGRVAKQAGGAVLLGMGETIVLGVATMSENPKDGIDFLPLTCDYEERKYAVGKIPGGFMKRGGRPSEKAILVSRLMDRPIWTDRYGLSFLRDCVTTFQSLQCHLRLSKIVRPMY
ncbi:MAG: hypothetical protein NTU72_06110 [Fimbriimonadales bacterium]|nr:hypothetical protein [Fimbriimonadales bacterium]